MSIKNHLHLILPFVNALRCTRLYTGYKCRIVFERQRFVIPGNVEMQLFTGYKTGQYARQALLRGMASHLSL
jgi:hypothetical protein